MKLDNLQHMIKYLTIVTAHRRYQLVICQFKYARYVMSATQKTEFRINPDDESKDEEKAFENKDVENAS